MSTPTRNESNGEAPLGWVKTQERRSKRVLMGLMGRLLAARPMTAEEVGALPMKRILVIRQQNQMGDMLLAVPALRAIREKHPDAFVGILASTLNQGVLRNNPYIDIVHTYDKRGPLGHLKLVREMRRQRYDLVIVLHTVSFSFTSIVLAVLSGATCRVGSTSPSIRDRETGSWFNFTLPLPDEAQLASMNEAEHNLYPLAAIGISTQNIAPLLVPTDDDNVWAGAFAKSAWDGAALKLVIHPGAGKTENIWGAERFSEVVDHVLAARDARVVAIQGPADGDTVERFVAAQKAPVTVVRGQSIGRVAALLKLADLVICNDTGVMHVSAAAGARTLAVFGPTDPMRWAPRCENLTTIRAEDGQLQSLTARAVADRALEIVDATTNISG